MNTKTILMSGNTTFLWTPGLAAINDPDEIVMFDENNSVDEDRYVAIGRSGSQILFVSFTMRDSAERIISVREATKSEKAEYWL